MRCAAVFGLLVIGGCNQIYGLDETAPAVPRSLRVELVAQIALTSTTTVGPDPMLRSEPLSPPPVVRVGPLDGALVDSAYLDTGHVEFPAELADATWRLEYQLGTDVPYEIQWSPPDGAGKLVVPIFGRLPRTPVPANSGYAITVKRAVTMTEYPFVDGVAYTTGLWSRVPFGQQGGPGMPVQLTASALQSLSGPPGTPDGAQMDQLVLADYEVANGCRTMAGSAELAAPALTENVTATGAATLTRPEHAVEVTFPRPSPRARLEAALGGALGTATDVITVGRVPTLALPAFTSTLDDVPGPVLIPLATCPIAPVEIDGMLTQTTDIFTDPTALGAFPAVLVTSFKNTRLLGTTQLASSIVAVQPEASATPNAYTSSTMDVPFATTIALGDGTTTLDLSAATGTDAQALFAPAGPLRLTFELERDDPGRIAHYIEVGLYRIDRAQRAPILERVYLTIETAAPALAIDPAHLAPGTEYAFAIRTHRGRPGASVYDFSQVEQPQAVASMFSRTFTTP